MEIGGCSDWRAEITTWSHWYLVRSVSSYLKLIRKDTNLISSLYDLEGPAGPTAFWKISDSILEEKRSNRLLPQIFQ
jgi:hypothetical protein